jgi:hypothetical protein
MALEITGKVHQVLPLETGEGKNGPWKKQFFILDYMDGNYPKKVSVSVWGDKTDALRQLKPGDPVKVAFNVESREYNGRWYTDVKAWKVEVMNETGGGSASAGNEPAYADPGFDQGSMQGGPDNDLPF